jgi:ABC-type sugar transport system ATPase subunit
MTTPNAASAPSPLIEARDLTKYFGSVIAIEEVSLSVRAGEVVCLLGDNGAGKSTLIKCLSGVHPPDSGRSSSMGARSTSRPQGTPSRHRHRLPETWPCVR